MAARDFDPSAVAAAIGRQLLIGEEETAELDLFSALGRNEDCPVCLEPMPLYYDDRILCHICGNMTCSPCVVKMRRTFSRKLCSVCNTDNAKELCHNFHLCSEAK